MNKDRLRRRDRPITSAQKSPGFSDAAVNGGLGSSSLSPSSSVRDHGVEHCVPLPAVVSSPTTLLPSLFSDSSRISRDGSRPFCRT